MVKELDNLKIHHITTGLNHGDYMTYRNAIKGTGMSSAAFLRIVVTIGLAQVVEVAKTAKAKANRIKALQTELNALQNGSIVTVANFSGNTILTPSGRFPKGKREEIIRSFLTLKPAATYKEIQTHLSQVKGKPVAYNTICTAMKRLGLTK